MRIFGHPLHPALVHFPIAFWTLATFLDGAALFGLNEAWRAAAILTGLGLLTGLVAMIPGLVDLAKLSKEAEKTGLYHMVFMSIAWCLYLIALYFHIENQALADHPNVWAFCISLLAFGCLAIGGIYGGEMVYRYKAGHIS